MRHRITVLVPELSTARSADGDAVYSYSSASPDIWAEIKTLRARSILRNDLDRSGAEIVFAVRHTTAIDHRCRIVHDGVTYEIDGVIDVDGRGRELEILARRTT